MFKVHLDNTILQERLRYQALLRSLVALQGCRNLKYSGGMDDGIEFNEAAFRHDISEEDIRWAATHLLYEDLWWDFRRQT
ncbi:hypothetical protein AGMMS50293_27130 [Spirochaetia bacterium]|nr:hypothetical protein AGMMS50293_27130 [Spirochaetia bacterium]